MKNSSGILLICFIFSIISCKSEHKKTAAEIVNEFFYSYDGYRTVNRKIVTKSLSSLLDQAVKTEETDRERITKSDYPTDKPKMIEGEIFCSLYEGWDSYSITNITINGNKAIAEIEFGNDEYKESWKDQMILMDEDGWKIDDVIYTGHTLQLKNTKSILKEFSSL